MNEYVRDCGTPVSGGWCTLPRDHPGFHMVTGGSGPDTAVQTMCICGHFGKAHGVITGCQGIGCQCPEFEEWRDKDAIDLWAEILRLQKAIQILFKLHVVPETVPVEDIRFVKELGK